MEARLAEEFTLGGSFEVKAGALGLRIMAKAGASIKQSTEVTLSPRTTFAYLPQKLKWENDKNRIEKLTDDQWGTR